MAETHAGQWVGLSRGQVVASAPPAGGSIRGTHRRGPQSTARAGVSSWQGLHEADGILAKVRNTPKLLHKFDASACTAVCWVLTTRPRVKFCELPLRCIPNLREYNLSCLVDYRARSVTQVTETNMRPLTATSSTLARSRGHVRQCDRQGSALSKQRYSTPSRQEAKPQRRAPTRQVWNRDPETLLRPDLRNLRDQRTKAPSRPTATPTPTTWHVTHDA